GCAVGPDGKLLDASEIQFFNDADDITPISGPATVPTPSTIPGVHPFFTRGSSPARLVAGIRRTARIPRPSAKATDPNNMESVTTRS
ncbi:hypothetical protein BD779DRAFT_1415765, partial [Infundibulicybe gibba]